VEGWDHELLYALRSEQARQETITYLHEILDYLQDHGKASIMLLATVNGEPLDTVAQQWHMSEQGVKEHTKKLRRKLRVWSRWSTTSGEEVSLAAAD